MLSSFGKGAFFISSLSRFANMPQEVKAKSILNRKKTRDSWFLDEYTLNPYSGCSFNCLYCYIRGSMYGTHMERQLRIKVNAPELLEKQLALRAKKGDHGFIVLASATDPYLQFEKDYQLTRQLLEIILKYRFPVHLITKSDLVQRDFDLINKIDEEAILPEDLQALGHGALLTFSFSTIDNKIGAQFEPGATSPSVRLETLKTALSAGIHSGVSLMPLLPFISDTGEQLEEMFRTFAANGAKYVMPATLTLFGNEAADSKTLMLRAVEKHYPHLLQKYHKFFDHSNEMPAYYRKAFEEKMKELGEKYSLPNRIFASGFSAP